MAAWAGIRARLGVRAKDHMWAQACHPWDAVALPKRVQNALHGGFVKRARVPGVGNPKPVCKLQFFQGVVKHLFLTAAALPGLGKLVE